MLKKLVKYGNSNALVLDKPILELLGIEEGSIVRLKTDGTSLIITPHIKPIAEPAVENVSAPVDQGEAFMRASVEMGISQNAYLYAHLSAEEKKQLIEDSLQNYREMTSATAELTQNPEIYQNYRAEVAQLLASKPDVTYAERQEIFYKYSPKMRVAQQKAFELEAKYKIPGFEERMPGSDKYQAMQADFSNLFSNKFKKANNCELTAETLNSPEYLHEMQLLAESHKAGVLTTEQYAEASRETMYKHLPEMRAIHTDVADVSAKFMAKNKNK
jgi:antitoxin component of MazEF toxin-antitoxin module